MNDRLAPHFGNSWCVGLPTEAEWEKAARGGKNIPAPSPLSRALMDFSLPVTGGCYPIHFRRDAIPTGLMPTRIAPISAIPRSKAPALPAASSSGASVYGCEDMSGNVWEWCYSCQWQENYSAYVRDDLKDPAYASGAARRALRGGSFFNYDKFVRCASRYSYDVDIGYGNLGFRVVVRPCFS